MNKDDMNEIREHLDKLASTDPEAAVGMVMSMIMAPSQMEVLFDDDLMSQPADLVLTKGEVALLFSAALDSLSAGFGMHGNTTTSITILSLGRIDVLRRLCMIVESTGVFMPNARHIIDEVIQRASVIHAEIKEARKNGN